MVPAFMTFANNLSLRRSHGMVIRTHWWLFGRIPEQAGCGVCTDLVSEIGGLVGWCNRWDGERINSPNHQTTPFTKSLPHSIHHLTLSPDSCASIAVISMKDPYFTNSTAADLIGDSSSDHGPVSTEIPLGAPAFTGFASAPRSGAPVPLLPWSNLQSQSTV